MLVVAGGRGDSCKVMVMVAMVVVMVEVVLVEAKVTTLRTIMMKLKS